jgi:hypothetical protein
MIITEYSGKATISFLPSGAELSFSAQAVPVEYLPLHCLNKLDEFAPLYVLADDGLPTQLLVKP